MKKQTVFLLSLVFLVALVFGGAYAVDRYRMQKNLPVLFSTWGYSYAPPAESVPAETEQSFLGTILEETLDYMLIEPAEGESERKMADKIKIEYVSDHIDFIYGLGRKVVIYYDGNITPGSPPTIRTDDISTEGFRDFSLSVSPSDTAGKKLMIRKSAPHDSDFGYYRPHNLYYAGLADVFVFTDGQTLPLADAIEVGKITTSAILAKANCDVKNGIVEELRYRDGGSVIFQYPTYTIIKYHTLNGNDDMYIGAPGIDIHMQNK